MKEKYILSAMMMDELALSKALSELTQEHFTTYKHIFKDFKDIYNKEKCLDVGLIAEKGYTVEQIADISMSASTSVYVDKYIEKLKEEKYIRDCKDYANKILKAKTIEDINDKISSQPILSSGKEIISMEKACQQSVAELERRAKSKNPMKGIPTGFRMLDYISGGWQRGQVILIEGATNVGKSLFAQNIAINIAKENFVMWFGFEMPKRQLADRFMMMHFKILTSQNYNNPKTITDKQAKELEKIKLDNVMKNLYTIGFDEVKHKTFSEIQAITYNEISKRGRKPAAIFIDYLSKIRGGRGQKKYERDNDNFQKIMDFAEDMMIPICLIVRQNGAGETAGDSEMLYDAHQHYVLTREDALAIVDIKKNRDGGKTGKDGISMKWVQDFLRFEEV